MNQHLKNCNENMKDGKTMPSKSILGFVGYVFDCLEIAGNVAKLTLAVFQIPLAAKIGLIISNFPLSMIQKLG